MLTRIVLILGAVASAYISVRALSAPADMIGNLGLAIENADGRNEVRGQYGGFFGFVAIALLLALFGRLPQRFALGLLLLTVGGVLFGRLASLAIEGPAVFAEYSAAVKGFLAFDIVMAALCVWALLIGDGRGHRK